MQRFAEFNIQLDMFIQTLSLDVAVSAETRAVQDAEDARARDADAQEKIDQIRAGQADSALSQEEMKALVEQLRMDVRSMAGFIEGRRPEMEAKKKSILDYSTRSVIQVLNKISLSDLRWLDPEGLIGEGSFGKVFKGDHKRTPVAIKILKTCTEADLQELKKEARVMQALEHPCVVMLLGIVYGERRAGSASNVLGVVMALSRCSLDDLLYKTRATLEGQGIRPPNSYLLVDGKSDRFSFALPFLLALQEDVASAIEYLHSIGVVHRDIKPANVLLDGDFRGKVCDFGLATIKASANTTNDGTTVAVKGTPVYMSPEALEGRSSKQGDVFALGILMNELLTQRRPFEGLSTLVVMAGLQNGKRPRVLVARESDGVSQDLLQCIFACWSTVERSRPTAAAVCSTIIRCMHAIGGDPRSKSSTSECAEEEPFDVSTELFTSRVATTAFGAASSESKIESSALSSMLEKWLISAGVTKSGRAEKYSRRMAEKGIGSIDELRSNMVANEEFLETLDITNDADIACIVSALLLAEQHRAMSLPPKYREMFTPKKLPESVQKKIDDVMKSLTKIDTSRGEVIMKEVKSLSFAEARPRKKKHEGL